MTQYSFSNINPNITTGTDLATLLNSFRDALESFHSGTSAPSYIVQGMIWPDNTTSDLVYRAYDGTDSIEVFSLDSAGNKVNMTNVALFQSNGIDDYSTSTRAILTDSSIILGSSGFIYDVVNSVDNQALRISGGNSSGAGAVWWLYGSTSVNVSNALLYRSSVPTYFMDGSTGDHYWYRDDGSTPMITADASTGRVQFSTGVTFGTDSSDDNTLDDYGQSVYNPTLTPQTSGSIILDSTLNTLSYTKIGDVVQVFGFLRVSAISSPTGYFTISLPLTSAELLENSDFSVGKIIINSTVSSNTNEFVGIVEGNSTTLDVYLGDSTTLQSDSAQQIQVGTDLYVQISYKAA